MDTVDPFRFLFAFLFVIGLIGVFAVCLRRWGKSHALLGMPKEGSGRLHIVEVRYIDARRKLVLVRRDDREHLLLMADGRELVIESGIAAGMMASAIADEKHA